MPRAFSFLPSCLGLGRRVSLQRCVSHVSDAAAIGRLTMNLPHTHALHAGCSSCPLLQARRTACYVPSSTARGAHSVSSPQQDFSCHRSPLRPLVAARRYQRVSATDDLNDASAAVEDAEEEDFEFEDDEDTDAFPGLLSDSVSSEIADVEVTGENSAEGDADWTDGLWGADEARPQAKGDEDEWEEAVLNVARVTKVVKGGRQMGFRADVVVGNHKGSVGVGCASAKEVSVAVTKAARDGRKHLARIPLTKSLSFPHFAEAYSHSAKVMLRPGRPGTGVIAGGAVRVVLQMAGVRNAYGKQLGCQNKLNNARATVQCLSSMRTVEEVAQMRGLSVADMLGIHDESKRKAIEKEPEEFMAPTEVPGNVARSDQDMRINVQPRVV